jgi:hypothetical protein
LSKRAAQRLFHRALAFVGVLSLGEADLLHDLVHVGDDALDDHGRVLVPSAFEELG